MLMFYKQLIIILMLCWSVGAYSQELRCTVSVSSQSIQGTNKSVFETLQTALNEFMNNQRWTDKIYANDERIECNFMINIKEMTSVDHFKGTVEIQARRPVYNSLYNSVIFNFQDQNFNFQYVEFEPLVFNPTTFDSNLIAMMAYYAYMVIGLDEDSFALYGGSSSFQKAESIVTRAQNASEAGWKSFENQRNRYWMVDNILDEYHKPLRECFYRYHRLGLDRMAEKVDAGRSEVADALELLKKTYRQKPGSFLLQVFFMAKTDEIINIFSESFSMEKSKVAATLMEVDPSNIDKYKVLTSSK